ncbi:hypothetical protein IAQ61_001321 [Plenodomus lingam]|uniref:uncharacterized protein n=1 Tax=Leptosphaeria maculans TaxID=5022 RepID=UPI0033217238|nr:hypothetical protein IAQ61_001321 [Plenodomus lingam]
MASADDAHSRAKRPAAMTRQSSSQSQPSQSPSEGHARPAHHKTRGHGHHVVGQRVQRNASFGKNLNKLNKAAQAAQHTQQAQAHTADSTGRHHRRSQSGASLSAPSSPRPSVKRNASSGAIVRAAHTAHTQANLRKNHSSGHLAHKGHAKHAVKVSKSDVTHLKRVNRSRHASPEPQATVHFDVAGGDDEEEEDVEEGGDDGWTEESASQSPTTTRSNTRSNSVVLEAQHKLAEKNRENNRGGGASQSGSDQDYGVPATETLPDRTCDNTRTNGSSSSQNHSRPANADMITSRLLQRSASHHNPAQTSNVAATVLSATHRQHLVSTSAGSTLVDTPGRDLVSRFMDGDGSAGTPHDGAYMPSHSSTGTGQDGELDNSKRNKSMPNVSGADTPSKAASRSGATTPTNLPPSRTQQKLMLQRASSAIEPQKLVPVTLPRTGGPTFLQSGIHYNANGEGRLDPRLQQQFNHVTVEYKVVRRYRNPLADSIARIQHIPGMSRKSRIPGASSNHGFANARGSGSLSTSFSNEAGMESDGASLSRRSRVIFNDHEEGRDRNADDEGDAEGRQSFESEGARSRDEAEEICRRLWESAEVVEAD